MIAEKNIIHKMTIEVDTNSMELGLQFKDDIRSFLEEYIYPDLELYFDTLSQNNRNETLRFSSLNLTLEMKATNSLRSIQPVLLKKLKEQIRTKVTSEGQLVSNEIERVSSEEKTADAFLYFLKTGRYPWWFSHATEFTFKLVQLLVASEGLQSQLKQLLQHTNPRKRLIFQFDNSLLQELYLYVKTPEKPLKKRVQPFPNSFLSTPERNRYWEIMFDNLLEITTPEKAVQELTLLLSAKRSKKKILQLVGFSKELFGAASPGLFKNLSEDTTKVAAEIATEFSEIPGKKKLIEHHPFPEVDDIVSEEGIIVQNAGLILLHPFLKLFFQKLGFLSVFSGEKKPGILSSKIDEAVHTLHYLACRQEQAYEHVLGFEKYLCNVPLQHPINRHLKLTAEQKKACDELLFSVLGHWEKLKTTSIEILRNEFLMRQGKLTFDTNKHHLFIQRKTQDLLTDTLPWTISIIKIPWKKGLLYTTW